MESILVTSGAGFIGSNLIQNIISEEQFQLEGNPLKLYLDNWAKHTPAY